MHCKLARHFSTADAREMGIQDDAVRVKVAEVRNKGFTRSIRSGTPSVVFQHQSNRVENVLIIVDDRNGHGTLIVATVHSASVEIRMTSDN